MSYNESKNPMSNYPMMSQSQWDNAPFNEPHNAERDFEVNVTYTLAKDNIGVMTNDYVPEYDEEDGSTTYNTKYTDWEAAYEEQHYSVLQMIDLLKEYVSKELSNDVTASRKRFLQRVLEDCDGWELVESEYEES